MELQNFLSGYKILVLFSYEGQMVPLVRVKFRVDAISMFLIDCYLLHNNFLLRAPGWLQNKLTVSTGQAVIINLSSISKPPHILD